MTSTDSFFLLYIFDDLGSIKSNLTASNSSRAINFPDHRVKFEAGQTRDSSNVDAACWMTRGGSGGGLKVK